MHLSANSKISGTPEVTAHDINTVLMHISQLLAHNVILYTENTHQNYIFTVPLNI